MRTSFFTIRQYAQRLGISHTAVCKAIKKGFITPNEYGLLDVAKADLDWIENYDMSRCRLPERAHRILIATTTEWLREQNEIKHLGRARRDGRPVFSDKEIEAILDEDFDYDM